MLSVPPDAFAVFDEQDSGCVSYGIGQEGARRFVKTAVTDAGRRALERAIAFHASVRHPAIVRPIDAGMAAGRFQIVYPWIDGIVLNQATVRGSDRAGLQRFRRLPMAAVLAGLERILDAHVTVAAAGFVSVDLYDGCFLYDFEDRTMHLIDLDEYRPGPFVSHESRLPGSTRYMAPEEFVRGATIDERTMVFQLGRTIHELAGEVPSPAQRTVVRTATSDVPDDRFGTVVQLVRAWRATEP